MPVALYKVRRKSDEREITEVMLEMSGFEGRSIAVKPLRSGAEKPCLSVH
ncbi:MAG: hypothetical protein MUF72_22285 [Elainella sp. Prado103]|nr:hypothetical protein [Elainella sp. Prado103]